MGLSDFFSSFMPTVYADEEPQVEETVEEVVEETPAAEEEVEEEEEEEEEPEDPKPAIWEGKSDSNCNENREHHRVRALTPFQSKTPI